MMQVPFRKVALSATILAGLTAGCGGDAGNALALQPLPAPSLPVITITDSTIVEGNSGTVALDFTISLSAPAALEVTVQVATADDLAKAADGDYAAATAALAFAPGEIAKTFSVVVTGDTLVEGDETLRVQLASPSNATLGNAMARGVIVDDDAGGLPVLSISAPAPAVNEGSASESSEIWFSVKLSSPPTQVVQVDVSSADGTATAGNNDYLAFSGTVTFMPGETVKDIAFTVVGDNDAESDETFSVTLSNPVSAALASAPSASATILNDDGVGVGVAALTMMEGTSATPAPAVLTVSLNIASAQIVTVEVSTADGTARVADGDYAANAQTLTFNPGETSKPFTVDVTTDDTWESDETIEIHLANATGGATIQNAQVLLTITNDDSVPGMMIVWGGRGGALGTNPASLADGAAYIPASDSWVQPAGLISGANAPGARYDHIAVWTGATGNPATENRMIVWGGSDGTSAGWLSDGAIYNPSSDSWESPKGLSDSGDRPSGRAGAIAVWTGATGDPDTANRMIVWGGTNTINVSLGDGAVYDPATDTWTKPAGLSNGTDRATARRYAGAVWTGSQMIVWCGWGVTITSTGKVLDNTYTSSGAVYDLKTDTWTQPTGLNAAGRPKGRHSAAVTLMDGKMLVWGGQGLGLLSDGGIYDPVKDAWTIPSILTTGSARPVARSGTAMIWTGSSATLFGGQNISGTTTIWLSDGGDYDPVNDTWQQPNGLAGPAASPLPPLAPTARAHHTMIWAGK